jgi:hypothetical protein
VVKAPGANNFDIDELTYTRIGRRATLLKVSQTHIFTGIVLRAYLHHEPRSQSIRSRAKLQRTFLNNLTINTRTRKASRSPTKPSKTHRISRMTSTIGIPIKLLNEAAVCLSPPRAHLASLTTIRAT